MRDDLIKAIQDVRATFPAIDLSDRRVFLKNLTFVYQVILATENLLRHAAENGWGHTRRFFWEHLDEERAHAGWLAEDLASAGMKMHDLSVSPEAAAMAGSQYYYIHHFDPVALLGYMAVLECFPTPLETVEALEAIHGKQLCRTLRHHAVHDIDHGEEVLKQIDGLDARQFELVKQNAVQTALYMGSAISKFEVQS